MESFWDVGQKDEQVQKVESVKNLNIRPRTALEGCKNLLLDKTSEFYLRRAHFC